MPRLMESEQEKLGKTLLKAKANFPDGTKLSHVHDILLGWRNVVTHSNGAISANSKS